MSTSLQEMSYVIGCIQEDVILITPMNGCECQVELVEPPESSAVGERVMIPGFEGNPDDVLNPKKKVFETVQPDLKTNKELVACYKGVPFTTSSGVCKAASISEGSIR